MNMSEEKTRLKKFIQNGVIRFQRVETTAEDIIQDRDNEIKSLKSLVDSLRARIEQLEQEQQRQTLLDKPVGSIDSYGCYS
jgi:polyhydroxyalkanoate synthesis regulator phasin